MEISETLSGVIDILIIVCIVSWLMIMITIIGCLICSCVDDMLRKW